MSLRAAQLYGAALWPRRLDVGAWRMRARSSPFARKVSVVLTGALIGQLASILLSPVLTRIYTPAEIGALGVFIAVVGVLSSLGTLRYEMTLPIAASESDALNLAALGLAALALTTALLSAGAYLAPISWMRGCQLGPLAPCRVLLPLGFAILALYQLASYMATRDGAFRAIAQSRMTQGAAAPALQVVLGLAGGGASCLAFGFLAGQVAGAAGLIARVWRAHRRALHLLSVTQMRLLARRYWRFPLIASWSALLEAAGGSQLLYVLISLCYAPRVAGFVFLAERVVARPLTLLGTSILQVYVGEAGQAALSDPRLLQRRFWQISVRQGAIALAWVGLANFLAAFLLPTLFGTAWGDALPFLQALSLAYLAQSLVEPVFHTLQILHRQALAAMWQVARAALVLGGFVVLSRRGAGAAEAVLLYALIQAGCSLVLFGLMAWAVGRRAREPASALEYGVLAP